MRLVVEKNRGPLRNQAVGVRQSPGKRWVLLGPESLKNLKSKSIDYLSGSDR